MNMVGWGSCPLAAAVSGQKLAFSSTHQGNTMHTRLANIGGPTRATTPCWTMLRSCRRINGTVHVGDPSHPGSHGHESRTGIEHSTDVCIRRITSVCLPYDPRLIICCFIICSWMGDKTRKFVDRSQRSSSFLSCADSTGIVCWSSLHDMSQCARCDSTTCNLVAPGRTTQICLDGCII